MSATQEIKKIKFQNCTQLLQDKTLNNEHTLFYRVLNQ